MTEKRELNSLDRTVKRMMLEYPSLFPSRLECLHTLFCVNGTGYKWKDGILVNALSAEDKPMPTKIKHTEPSPISSINEELEESELIRQEYEGVIRAFTEKNIDYLCRDIHHTNTRMSVDTVYPMSWDYCNMSYATENPHRIDPNWRRGIQEFIHWYLPAVKGHFGSDVENVTRMDADTVQNYEICQRVLKDMKTDEERINAKRFRKQMRKYMHQDRMMEILAGNE